jgi:hypothetical protein
VSSSSDFNRVSAKAESEYNDLKDNHGGIAATTATSHMRLDVVVVGCTVKTHARQ